MSGSVISEQVRRQSEEAAAEIALRLSEALNRDLRGVGGGVDRVVWRVKSDASLSQKQKPGADICMANDFIGIRLVVLHVGLLGRALRSVEEWCKDNSVDIIEVEDLFSSPGLGSYHGIHIDVQFNPSSALGLSLDRKCGVEVQITTYLQDIHAQLTHQLIYKGSSGDEVVHELESISQSLSNIDDRIATLLSRFHVLAEDAG